MELSSTIGTLSIIVVVAMNSFLAAVVLWSDTKSNTNRVFGLLTALTSIWLVANYLSVNPGLLDESILYIRATFFFAVPVNLLFFFLAWTLPNTKFKMSRLILWILIGASALVMLVTISPITISSVDLSSGRPIPVVGPGILLFGIHSITFNILAVLILLRKFLNAKGRQRRQLGIVAWGVLLMFGLIIATIFLPVVILQQSAFVDLFSFYALIFLGMTAYAIIEHRLFNIKVVATKAGSAILWIVLAANIFVADSAEEMFVDIIVLVIVLIFGIVVIRSVTKEIEQRRTLEQLTKKLKTLSDMKSNFVSIASHQLRAPVGGVRGYLSMIRDGDFGKVDKKVKDILDLNLDTLNHTLHVIETFLNVTRIESGKLDLKKEDVDLCALARDVFVELRPTADRKKIKFQVVCKQPEVFVFADPGKLREVVFNLIENALKYTDEGSIEVEVDLGSKNVEFRVKDTGIGIAKEEVSKLFKKFVRAGGGFRVSHGSGLGLYVAKMLTEAHKGKVFVESAGVGKGSTFGFRIPHFQKKTAKIGQKKG